MQPRFVYCTLVALVILIFTSIPTTTFMTVSVHKLCPTFNNQNLVELVAALLISVSQCLSCLFGLHAIDCGDLKAARIIAGIVFYAQFSVVTLTHLANKYL